MQIDWCAAARKGVGALAGAAVASSAYNGYYGPGYAYGPDYYAYDAAPGYDSYAYDGYAYSGGPAYSYPSYGYYDNSRSRSTNNFSIESQR